MGRLEIFRTMDATGRTHDVVIVGGGVIGASTALQLARRGLTVSVLERSMLGSGSTGRAAGLLGQLRSTPAATKMLVDGVEIVKDLESQTGKQIFVQTGSLRVAANQARAREIREHVVLGREAGLIVEHVDRDELSRLIPYMRRDDVIDACYCPTDGHLQPAELLAAFVEAGRAAGVQFVTNAAVKRTLVKSGRVVGVKTADREISAPVVVNAAGPWSYLVAENAGTRLAAAALGHYYLTTFPLDGVKIERNSPAVRDRENRIYSRPEAGGLIVGMYESQPIPYDMAKLPDDFQMAEMRARRDELNVALLLDAASRRFPFITPTTRMTITTGIMTFTPDGKPLCGADREVHGLFHASGFCGHGIVQSPTIGRIMAELIVDGASSYDVEAILADRFDDVDELRQRPQVEAQCYQAYANYYGKVAVDEAN